LDIDTKKRRFHGELIRRVFFNEADATLKNTLQLQRMVRDFRHLQHAHFQQLHAVPAMRQDHAEAHDVRSGVDA
jgi:hypothetical protein